MPFLIKALITFPMFYFLVGSNFRMLWKAGLIGVGIMLIADYVGFHFDLYNYQHGFTMLVGFMPPLHIFNMYLISMMYLKWLPQKWGERILYTIYLSVIFLAIEAVMYQADAITYYNWELWYSYFLNIGGLSLFAYLSDFKAISSCFLCIEPCKSGRKSKSLSSGCFNKCERIAEALLPKVSDTTLESMILETVREFCTRFFSLDAKDTSLER